MAMVDREESRDNGVDVMPLGVHVHTSFDFFQNDN